ncbi:MAG TPA: VOC family protein [Solirubrobacterales bacterium]|nr:VOC family protein [Solirubrobacterales bacterium]
MLDHLAIRAADLGASERFYRATLGALGIEPTRSGADRVEWDDFVVEAANGERPPTRHLHVGFVAPSREHVDEFWRVGIAAGYEDDGAPGKRPEYTEGYYGAFLRDPDGNSAEAVHHGDVRRGGNIDHLWIRVTDLDAAIAFYRSIMRHVGLREGRGWDQGQQFRGAWATFSLIADGTPPTEHLHLAFPAPDRRAVEDFYAAAGSTGGRAHRPPGELPRLDSDGYAASLAGPDGAQVESVFRLDQ